MVYGMLKKIDQIMANLNFSLSFVGANAIIQPYWISNHALAILRIPMLSLTKPRPFKFSNIVVHNVWFKEIMVNTCQQFVSRFWMFKVVKHLKLLKKPLRKLLYDHGNVCENVKKLRHELDEAQKALDADPKRFLIPKAKVEWLKLGDANTTYFYKVVKSQVSRNRIDTMTTSNGDWINGDHVHLAFINHYMDFLGQQEITSDFNAIELFCNQIPTDVAYNMVRDVSDQEIHKAIFCMGDNKAPGPDGYSAAFFKEAWDIISGDVIKVVKEYFVNGVLLKELNHTIISLIPKVTTLTRINDYRPISCCNVLYKCISKIISNRMKDSLSNLVNLNQSAFVPGRCISDNILLTRELMHNYQLDQSTPRCAFKVDIQKAYDTVDWKFLKEILICFGFYPRMIGWIMKCVTSTYFLLSITGSHRGYFKRKRGLRQGDPMSPYLFTLVMEEFKNASGLTPSLPKITAYFCNVLNHVKLDILQILPFEEGKLSIKYLGVPLVPSWLLHRDCMKLMEKVKRRINDWKNNSLSLAGRAQLIRSVLGEMKRSKAKVGNGTSISAWFDDWCCSSPLADFISNRDIYRAGLGLSATVSDIVDDGSWYWPPDWSSKYPRLANVNVPNLIAARDLVVQALLEVNMELCHIFLGKGFPRRVIATWSIRSYKNQFEEYLEINKQKEVYGLDAYMEYDPSNVDFSEWLTLKLSNHKTMDWYTKNALWIYWTRGDDEEVITDDELLNPRYGTLIEEIEITKIFRIETNIFQFETPLCEAIKEFNYLLKIDVDVLTNDIPGFKTYDEYKDAWIYERNKDVPWEKYCNEGDLPRVIRIEDEIYFETYEWYENIEDGELKDEALNYKAILEESMNVEEESSDNTRNHHSPIDEWEDIERANHVEADADSNYNLYLDVSRIFNDHAETNKDDET
uniref:Reverse transcriptase domain-containing protein n=1 Tax=Tanacetum cinerariifolium TaxID=118510 RepID=A0A699HFQ4_TANCI|nr:hypothetical protein [Tanacetum cinerariifolium]